jgi:hypothetical protein
VSYSNIKTPLTTKNGVAYNLQYDPNTGGAQIIQQNAPPGTKPIYQDGRWNSSASQLGFSSGEQTQLHQQTIASVQAAYNSIGGVNSGAKLGQWASQNFTTGQPGQTSVTPQQAVSGTSGRTAANGIENTAAFLLNTEEFYKNLSVNGNNFGVGNEREVFGGTMKYPLDLMTNQQDTFVISQFRYIPTKASAIFGGTAGAVSTLLNGLQQGSPIGPLESTLGTVFLPMPNSISDNNSVVWGDDAMGNLSAALAAQTSDKIAKGGAQALAGAAAGMLLPGAENLAGKAMLGGNLLELIRNGAAGPELTALLGTEGISKILKFQGLGVEAESILARGAGIVPNSNLELLFQSPTLRKFNFTYRLSPRSAEEAKTIRRIIRFFKQGMAAKKMRGKAGAASFFLGTPNVFKLEYRSANKPIDAVNKFKTCALTSFSCNYTPDGLWAAYDRGQPVSTIISMSFDELEPIYDTDYQGFDANGNSLIMEGRTDLSPISNNSVGY